MEGFNLLPILDVEVSDLGELFIAKVLEVDGAELVFLEDVVQDEGVDIFQRAVKSDLDALGAQLLKLCLVEL